MASEREKLLAEKSTQLRLKNMAIIESDSTALMKAERNLERIEKKLAKINSER